MKKTIAFLLAAALLLGLGKPHDGKARLPESEGESTGNKTGKQATNQRKDRRNTCFGIGGTRDETDAGFSTKAQTESRRFRVSKISMIKQEPRLPVGALFYKFVELYCFFNTEMR